MTKKIIIGAGFSAVITKILIGKKVNIIGLHNHNFLKKNSFLRRKSLDSNKFFQKNTYSYGTLNFDLKKGKMHDRLILGGNSSIWGGHINLRNIKKKMLSIFKIHNVVFKKLSFKNTGAISNNKDIYQVQTLTGNILESQNLYNNIKNAYILNFFIKRKKIFVNMMMSESGRIQKFHVSKLFLCLGTVQFLDLLYRSNFIKENDIIELSEFSHKFKFTLLSNTIKTKNATIIRYKFSRALGHFLGIQSFSKYLKFLNFLPVCIDQYFYKRKKNYKLQIKKGQVIEKDNDSDLNKFGVSAHYCNLRINKVPINKFLKRINPNIFGIGMSFIDQKIPGPISNDIILDVQKKINL
tara:strand:- start:184 stop:1239 length:1056 start_codon:yes stop_codon:yes gene_type:complete